MTDERNKRVTANSDSDYYRRSASVFHNLRYLVLLFLLVLVIIGFTAYRRELTLENFRYIMRYADFDTGADFHSSNQISFAASEDTKFGYLKGDLAMLSSKGFSTYDFTGQEIISEKSRYLNPTLKVAEKYALCYDAAGTELAIYNSYSCIFTDTYEYGIKDACIRSDGSFAVATSGKYLSSKVIVYGDDGAERFTWETRNKEVIAVSMPEESDTVSFIALEVSDGDFMFTLFTFDCQSEEPIFANEYYGEFPLRLHCENGTIAMLTDRNLYFEKDTGESAAVYPIGEDKLTGFFKSGDYIALTFAKSVSGNSTMRIYDTQGNKITSDNFENNIIGFSAYGNNIYALEKGKLHIRQVNRETDTAEYKNVSELSVDSLYCDVFAKSGNEYILVSPKGAGKFS